MPSPLAVCAAMLCMLVPPAVAQAPPAAPPAYEANPKFASAMKDAKQCIHERQYNFAVDAYKKANKIAGGQCVSCLQEAYDWQMKRAEFKDAAALAGQILALAANPRDKSMAETDQAIALLRAAGDKPKPAQLETVHALYQSALKDFPKNLAARYSDGCVLARMGKMDDASQAFSACAEAAAPTDPARIRARHFAENPALSTAKMAPAFTVTALDGSRFTLDEMGGRVVLIDFWATWCGPCNEELPHIRKIAKEFAGQPLVIISISWDSDEAKWKAFLQKNDMTWVQYRDADHDLSNRFGVNAIPHYFTIDSDGVLTAEMLGSGSDVEGKLKKLIARAKASGGAPSTLAAGN
jgi:thiol-disulfide isomerase/thioredoxin